MKERDTFVAHEDSRGRCEQFAFREGGSTFVHVYLAILICHNVGDTFASMRPDTTRFSEVKKGIQERAQTGESELAFAPCTGHMKAPACNSQQRVLPCAGIFVACLELAIFFFLKLKDISCKMS